VDGPVGIGRRAVPSAPNNRQNPRLAGPPGGLPGAGPAAAAAPAFVYGSAAGAFADVEMAQVQRPAEPGTLTDPLPDLVNTHRVPGTGQLQQPLYHHHHHCYQHNVQQQQLASGGQQQQQMIQQQDGGAEMMMLYDDPGRCWLSQYATYRNANPFAQYVSTAAAYGQPIYQRADDGNARKPVY
jgi:hypothetical protein